MHKKKYNFPECGFKISKDWKSFCPSIWYLQQCDLLLSVISTEQIYSPDRAALFIS